MIMENYSLILYFNSKCLTAREYVDFSKEILLRLREIDPIFTNLFGWGKKANARRQISSDMHNFDEIVFEQIRDNSIAYQNPDPKNKEFTWQSKCFIGYSNSYSNTTRIKEGKISINITGGQENDGILIIDFPQYNYPQFSDYSFIRKLFLKSISLVNADYGCVISNKFTSLVKRDKDKIWIGWFTYLKKREVCELLPADLMKEKTESGIVFTLSKTMPQPTDQEIIDKALNVRNLLRDHKLI